MEYHCFPTIPLSSQVGSPIIDRPIDNIPIVSQQIIDPLPTTHVFHDPIMPIDIPPMSYPIYQQPPMMIPPVYPQVIHQPMPIIPPQQPIVMTQPMPQPIVMPPQPQPVVVQPPPQPIVMQQPQPVIMAPQPQPIVMPPQPVVMAPQPQQVMVVPGTAPQKLVRPVSAPVYNNSMIYKPAQVVPVQPVPNMPARPLPQVVQTRPTLGRPIQPSQSAMFVPVQPTA